MDKVKSNMEVYNQYTSLINGAITYTFGSTDYVIANGQNTLSRMKIISGAMAIKGLTESPITTINFGLVVVSKECIDYIINKMIVRGYDCWIEKNDRQTEIDNATTQEEIDAVVNRDWNI